ncbi:MAG: glycosyltransferase family 2 protein [Clostridia bacterium]|nr:glycosyltransferase family 2 protein [Clostridia bacterium]
MVSVVLAAYNGGEYIKAQLDSVLSQLGADDEVIISDDKPSGTTKPAVEDVLASDPRVKYIEGPGKGVIKNFEHAIKNAKGDYIFLCDQDDIWLDGKVDAVVAELEKGAVVVMHDAKVVNNDLEVTESSFFAAHGSGTGTVKNVIRNTYIGCCMAFRKELKPHILPFPDNLPMHDQWIGLKGEKAGKVSLINKPYLLYRRHDGTATGGATSFLQKIKWRIAIISSLIRK